MREIKIKSTRETSGKETIEFYEINKNKEILSIRIKSTRETSGKESHLNNNTTEMDNILNVPHPILY